MAEPVYRIKYCLKDGKTGWQNLYIGRKIEKRGRRNMYTLLDMLKQDGRTCISVYRKQILKKGGGGTCILC